MKDKRTNVIRWNYYRQLQSNYRHNKHIIRYKEKLLFFLIRIWKIKKHKKKNKHICYANFQWLHTHLLII